MSQKTSRLLRQTAVVDKKLPIAGYKKWFKTLNWKERSAVISAMKNLIWRHRNNN